MTTEEAPTTRYTSYLLRLRLMSTGKQTLWLASMDDTLTGKHRSFPNVEALAAYLLAEFGGNRSASENRSVEAEPSQPDDR